MRRSPPYFLTFLLARAALALLLAGAPALASAQDAKPTETPSAPDASATEPAPAEAKDAPEVSLAAVVGDAGAAQVKLREIESALAPDAAYEDLIAELPELIAGVKERAAVARKRIEEAGQLRQLQDVENQWLNEQQRGEDLREQLTGRALAIQESSRLIDEISAVWEKSKKEAQELHAPPAVMSQIGRTLHAVDSAREQAKARSAGVLELQATLGRALGIAADVLERTRLAKDAVRGGLLATDGLPLWTAIQENRDDFNGILTRALQVRRLEFADATDYARQELPELALHLTLLILGVLAALALRPRALRWAEEDPNASTTAQVLTHPYAAGFLIAAIASPFLYQNAPSNWEELFLFIALLAALRLLPQVIEPEIRPAFYALAGFFIVDRLRDMSSTTPLLARGIFIVEMLGFAAVILFMLRPERLALLPNGQSRMPIFVFARRVALGLLATALVSSVLGLITLSELLGNGVIFSTYGAVAIYGAYKVLSGMAGIFLRGRVFAAVRVIEGHREAITQGLLRLLRWGAVLGWLFASAELFGVRDPLIVFFSTVLASELAIGQLKISLGGILVFVIAVSVAIYIARLVRYVLDEDVLPRLSLPRGVPDAISSMTFLALLLVGFLAAIAAAGIDLSGFALIGGALGVGIGFGLQNVVNNFVSGLILRFERPIKTGDTIALGTLFGEVRQIGIRSSTVRTWQGADVIVPNADLISNQVVNWTYLDRRRRIELDVGVKYGTDPERVLQLLLDVAAAEDRVLTDPEPSALFLEFGESSLDFQLRAWTARADEWMRIRSDMNVAINRALAEAGIEIPFPQRDLHLRGVDPEAGRALAAPRERS